MFRKKTYYLCIYSHCYVFISSETQYKVELPQYEMPKEVEEQVVATDTAALNPW